MFDWFFHVLGLKSPREMKQLERDFQREMRQLELKLACAMADTLTGEYRERVDAALREQGIER